LTDLIHVFKINYAQFISQEIKSIFIKGLIE